MTSLWQLTDSLIKMIMAWSSLSWWPYSYVACKREDVLSCGGCELGKWANQTLWKSIKKNIG